MLKDIDLTVLGNIFFVLFADTNKNVKVRSIPVDEVVEIICNPEDSKEPWYYKRSWRHVTFNEATGSQTASAQSVAYYPDWRFSPTQKPQSIGGKPVKWESPVYHVKVGGMSDMRFGVPETYAALDWAKAYKEFLEDVATIMRALSRFAWNMNTTGGQRGRQAAVAKLATTLGVAGSPETKPPPVAGSTFVSSEGSRLDPINTRNAAINGNDGRRFLLMVCAATGFPETFYGEVDVGNLATAKSLDRPTELKMRDRQMLWADVFKDILGYAVALKSPAGNRAIDTSSSKVEAPTIDVGFPPILEHDVDASVTALVKAATLDGKPPAGVIPMETLVRLLLTALGVDDIDEIVKGMDIDSLEAPADEGEGEPTPTAESLFVEAVRELRQAIQEKSPTVGQS